MAGVEPKYVYAYPRPMVTVDALLLAGGGDALSVLLIRRKLEPYAGHWALPGGFVDMEESLELAAARELEEETGVHGVHLEQLRTFGDPGRDPRGRTISVVYWAVLYAALPVQAADDATEARWWPVSALPDMAFDHAEIIRYALGVLEERIDGS